MSALTEGEEKKVDNNLCISCTNPHALYYHRSLENPISIFGIIAETFYIIYFVDLRESLLSWFYRRLIVSLSLCLFFSSFFFPCHWATQVQIGKINVTFQQARSKVI